MIRARRESWPIAGTFRIARGERSAAEVVVVEVSRAGAMGHGESVPYARYGESVDGVVAAIEALPDDVTRDSLATLLDPGAARNAVDCALWDLEAKLAGRRAWELAGTPEPDPVTTCFTLSLDAPDAMAARAREHASWPLLKIKVSADGALERLRAVHAAAPDAELVVDANESWTAELYARIAPELRGLRVVLIEQPLPASAADALAYLPRPVPVCADESCHVAADVVALRACYDAVNVKLDKTGGLTEALALVAAARAAGLRIMVGCIVGTSLAVAPATVLIPFADIVDLDAPLLLAHDRDDGLRYEASTLYPPSAALWG